MANTTNQTTNTPASTIGTGSNTGLSDSGLGYMFHQGWDKAMADSTKAGDKANSAKGQKKGKGKTEGSQLGTAPTPSAVTNGVTNASIQQQYHSGQNPASSNPTSAFGAPVQAATPTTPQYLNSQAQMAQPMGQVQSAPPTGNGTYSINPSQMMGLKFGTQNGQPLMGAMQQSFQNQLGQQPLSREAALKFAPQNGQSMVGAMQQMFKNLGK